MKFLKIKLHISLLLFVYVTSVLAAPVDKADAVKPIDKFNASVGLGIENSDNVFLSPTNRKSDTIFHETFSLNYKRNSPTVQTLFSLNADHEHYQKKSFTDQNIFSSLLAFDTILIKNRLNWTVSNRFDHIQTQSSALNLPTNKENTNSFTTGPTFILLKSSRQFLNVSLNYKKLYTQKSDIDSSSYTAIATYNRDLTRTFSLKLNATHDARDFVNSVLNTDYRRTDAVITLTKRLKLSEIYATAGKTRVVRKGESNIEHGIIRLGYQYQIPNFSSLKVSYDRELGDFTGVFTDASQSNQLLPNIGSQIFLMTRGSLSINRSFGSSSIGYSYSYFGADYSNSLLNSVIRDSAISYVNSITPSLELGLNGSYTVSYYESSDRKDSAYIYAGTLTKRMSGVYSLALKLQYTQRKSNLVTFSYDERRIIISGKYHFN